MRRRLAAALTAVLVTAGLSLIFLGSGAQPGAILAGALPAVPGVAADLVSVRVDSVDHVLEVVVGPVHIPAGNDGHRVPIQLVRLPAGGALHGFAWEITDADGRRLPDELLHHVNLIDPDQRDLFSNTARRVAAAGRETGAQSFARFIGYPLPAGTRLLIVAMFSNPSAEPLEAHLRMRLRYSRYSGRFDPVPVFPFSLDVMGPVGEKSFAVPPGRTERSWEGSPAMDARVIAIGGHLHDYATRLRLEDLTTGRVLWESRPRTENGRIVAIPVDMAWKRGGIALHRAHRYRVSVVYENPTAAPTPHGGMGVIAGIAHVRGEWPALRRDETYRTDLANVISAPHRAPGHGGQQHMH